jgi:hypothetical protein
MNPSPAPGKLVVLAPPVEPWHHMQRAFDGIPLHGVAWGLNHLCKLWESGDTRPATIGPEYSALRKMEAKSTSYYWAAAETWKQAALWSPPFSFNSSIVFRDAPVDRIGKLVHHASAAYLEVCNGDPTALANGALTDFVFPIFAPQFMLTRYSSLRIGQALWMFEDAPKRRVQRVHNFPAAELARVFATALGMPLIDFIRGVFVLAGHSMNKGVIDSGMYLDAADAEAAGLTVKVNGVYRSALPEVLAHISASPSEARAWIATQLSAAPDDDRALLAGPNPLLQFPLARPFRNDPTRAIAPVPDRVLEWLYEPMIDTLFKVTSKTPLQSAFSALFEEYVGMVLDAHAPDGGPWLPESALGHGIQGQPVIDWARDFGDVVVLVDAKRTFIEAAKRHRLDPSDWKNFEKELKKAARQGAGFWRLAKSGMVPALRPSSTAKPVLAVVTESDSFIYGNQERIETALTQEARNLEPDLKVVVLSLDQLQQLAVAWRTRDSAWLPTTLNAVADKGRGLLRDVAPHKPDGPLMDAVERLFTPRARELLERRKAKFV